LIELKRLRRGCGLMRNFRDLTEAKDTIVYAYGRFNPPTIGHEKLITKVAKIAGSNPFRIYPSHSQNPKKDPLPQALKTAYMRKMFKKYAKNIIVSKSKNAIEIAVELYDQGYKNLIMVAGSDRVKVFDVMLNNYNGVEGKPHGYYKFDSIKVVSAGERDPDAEGVEGMSASKVRAAAVDGDYDSFSTGIPNTLSDADKKKMYRDVRKNMGIREERDMGDMSDFETLRDAYLVGEIWNVGDVVEANDIRGEIIRKGANYLSFMTDDGKVHKAWLHDIVGVTPMSRPTGQIFALKSEEVELDEAFPVQVTVKDKKGKTHTTGTRDLRGATHALLIHYKEIPAVKGGLPGSKETKPPKTEIFLGTEGELAKTAKRMLKQHPSKKYATGAEVVKLDQKMVRGATLGEANEWGELDERNYAKEYANYGGRPEQIARRSSRNKARRAMGDKAVKGMDVGHADNNPMNNDPKNLRMEKPSDNRREPRLREEDELDEMSWYKVALAKISQLNHPKDYEKMLKRYMSDMKKPELKNKTASYIAARIANDYKGQDGRKLVQYINKLVDDGKLPKELKAELQSESFSDFVKKINEVKQDKDVDDKKGTQPSKYYAGDMAKSTKDKRDAHFKKKKSGPAPGDSAKTKPSTHTKKVKQMCGEVLPNDADQGDYIDDFQKSDAPQFKGKSKEKRKEMAIAAYLSKNEEVELDEKIAGLVKKSEKSGMSYSILKKVYDRGMAAWKTGHRPGTTPQQWAFARVNSFTTKSSGTWGKADKDLAKQVEQIEEACWDGYKQVGMKKKGDKEVPNCVPEETDLNEWGEIEEESEYQGRKVTLNKPTSGDVKKSKVYVKNEKGNVVKVNFGDPNMKIKVSDPARRKSFRARHNCENPGPKWMARYWSCKAW